MAPIICMLLRTCFEKTSVHEYPRGLVIVGFFYLAISLEFRKGIYITIYLRWRRLQSRHFLKQGISLIGALLSGRRS